LLLLLLLVCAPLSTVARFGDKEHAERTVFATMHDLSAIFETHKQLEEQKTPESNRGPPFVVSSVRLGPPEGSPLATSGTISGTELVVIHSRP
jgi:hypothetical protein